MCDKKLFTEIFLSACLKEIIRLKHRVAAIACYDCKRGNLSTNKHQCMGGDLMGQREYLKKTIRYCLPMLKERDIFKHLQQLTEEYPKYRCISINDLYAFFNENGCPMDRVTWDSEWFDWLLEKLEAHYMDIVTAKCPDFLHAMDELVNDILIEEK